jgi:hypothetical protein
MPVRKNIAHTDLLKSSHNPIQPYVCRVAIGAIPKNLLTIVAEKHQLVCRAECNLIDYLGFFGRHSLV